MRGGAPKSTTNRLPVEHRCDHCHSPHMVPSIAGGRTAALTGLAHRHKPAAFGALRCGGALVFQDAEPFVEGHGRLLRRRRARRSENTSRRPDSRRAATTHRFPNAVDVKLQRNSFRYFFLYRFHHGRDGTRGRGVQGPGGGGPTASKPPF